ncbi:hypothetical protein COCNU_scaffold026768G000030 [Cocos nucifera]|nr:hypothetical protein [Cocos nucifera]
MGTRAWMPGFLFLLAVGAAWLPGSTPSGPSPPVGLCLSVFAGDSILGDQHSCASVNFPPHKEQSSYVIDALLDPSSMELTVGSSSLVSLRKRLLRKLSIFLGKDHREDATAKDVPCSCSGYFFFCFRAAVLLSSEA